MQIDTDEIKREKGHDMLLQKIHAERQHIRDLRVILKQRRGLVEVYAKQCQRYKWQCYAINRLGHEGVDFTLPQNLFITAKRKQKEAAYMSVINALKVRVVKEKIKNAQRRLSRLSAKFKAQSSEE